MIEEFLVELLNREPFDPFRIKLINGDGHDIVYAASAAVLDEGVFIASQDGHWVQFPFTRIASFESLTIVPD